MHWLCLLLRAASLSSLWNILFIIVLFCLLFLFFFNDTATTEIYTLSLHDALPISRHEFLGTPGSRGVRFAHPSLSSEAAPRRSEEHTSELQSHSDLVCRLLLEKKKRSANTPFAVVTIDMKLCKCPVQLTVTADVAK